DPDGEIGGADRPKALSSIPLWCTTAGFLRDDRYVSICPDPNPDGATDPAPWLWLELDSSGAIVARKPLPGTRQWYADPLLDRANGAVWLWDPVGLSLLRISDDGNRI